MPSVFVPGKLVNPLNGAHGHWAAKAAYRKRWREMVALMLRVQAEHGRSSWWPHPDSAMPKRLTLTASTWATMDADGLAAACKPILDGCVDAGLLHSDAPDSGHVIEYKQKIDRRRRGVAIAWEPL